MDWEEGRFEGIEGGGKGGHNGITLLGVNGEDPVAQAALPFGGLEHNSAEEQIGVKLTIRTAERRPGERPGANGVLDVIAASSGHKDGFSEGEQLMNYVRVNVVCQAKIRQRVAGEGISAKLKDKNVGFECVD